jgi:hypothetical protein
VGKKEKGRGSLTKRPPPSSETETGGSTARSDRPAPVIAGAPGSAAAGGRGNGEKDAGYLPRLSPWSGTPCGGGSAARDGRRRQSAAAAQLVVMEILGGKGDGCGGAGC